MKILIADDSEAVRFTIPGLLQLLGHETATAGTLEEAANHLEAGGIDAVIMDPACAAVGGLDLLAGIRGHKATCELPVIVFTASNDETLHRLSMELRADAYWQKEGGSLIRTLTLLRSWFPEPLHPGNGGD